LFGTFSERLETCTMNGAQSCIYCPVLLLGSAYGVRFDCLRGVPKNHFQHCVFKDALVDVFAEMDQDMESWVVRWPQIWGHGPANGLVAQAFDHCPALNKSRYQFLKSDSSFYVCLDGLCVVIVWLQGCIATAQHMPSLLFLGVANLFVYDFRSSISICCRL
jgi:hypothetical protein